jgi:pimeloyl-ACP methyl ester carboxylesterase
MSKKKTGLIGGAVGLAAGVAALAVAVEKSASARRGLDTAQFARVPADRHGFLVAEDGIGLYYEELGPRDAPLTVVFVHGFCLTSGAFVFQRAALSAAFRSDVRLVLYDQRSHGRSERSGPERSSIDQLGWDLFDLLDTLAPSGPVILVGHSMGGMTVLALVDAHPELFRAGSDGTPARVQGVVLLSTSTGKIASVTLGLPSAFARLTGPVIPVLLHGARRRPTLIERGRAIGTDIAWVFTKKLSFARDVDPALVEFLTGMISRTRIDVIAEFYSALLHHDKLAALGNLTETRVLVISGERDMLTPLEHTNAIAAALPSARLVVVPDAGHMALMEAPDEVDPPISELVAEVLEQTARRPRRQPRRQRA